jgi:hypothetical protein
MRASSTITIGILAMLGVAACSGGGEPSSGSGAPAQASGAARGAASSQASGAATPGNASDAGTIAVGPLKITIDGKALELKDDGTFSIAGKTMGTFSKNEIKLADGKHAVSVARDGAITINANIELNQIGAKFTDKDSITTTEKGVVLAIEDDGKVVVAHKEDQHPVFTGFKPELRRAASLMIMLFMLEPELRRLPAENAPPTSSSAAK